MEKMKLKAFFNYLIKGFWALVKSALSSPQIREQFTKYLVKSMNLKALGGVRGFILGFVAKYFASQIVAIINATSDKYEISEKVDEANEMEDRNEASRIVNDLIINR